VIAAKQDRDVDRDGDLLPGQIRNGLFMRPFVRAYERDGGGIDRAEVREAMRDAEYPPERWVKSWTGWTLGGVGKKGPGILKRYPDDTVGIASQECFEWARKRVDQTRAQLAAEAGAAGKPAITSRRAQGMASD
jgi:hypothetical protein